MEAYEKWVPLPGCPPDRFLTATVVVDHPDVTVRLQRGTRSDVGKEAGRRDDPYEWGESVRSSLRPVDTSVRRLPKLVA
jgi:hypothetical protein